MKYSIIIVGIVIIFFASFHTSCSKGNNDSNSPDSTILMSHSWYPSMVRVLETDSGNVFSANKDTVVFKDTTYYFRQCFQQSTYLFNHNHILNITNGCDLYQQTVISEWNLTATKGMVMMVIFDGTNPLIQGIGQLTEIDKDHFVFNSPYNYTINFGGTSYEQTVRNCYVTFRKK